MEVYTFKNSMCRYTGKIIPLFFLKKTSGHQRKLSGSEPDTNKRKCFSDNDLLNWKTCCPRMLWLSKSAQANSWTSSFSESADAVFSPATPETQSGTMYSR